MLSLPFSSLLLVIIALVFGFFNGLHDSSNVVATVISTRALSPRRALWLAALAIGLGPLLFGVAVATTIGQKVVAQDAVSLHIVYAALAAAIVWNVFTLRVGIPSSTSHALIGGIIGAVWVGSGRDALMLNGLETIFSSLLISPFLGMVGGFYVIKLSMFLARGASPHINNWFKRGQLLTAATLALAHGTNDAQKTMGVIVLGLRATGQLDGSSIPLWVILISASVMGMGTLFGGWKLIRTLGAGFYRIRPIHGFSAQTASTAIILGAAMLGGPVSTTHVMSSAIVGAGAAERVQMVRWGVVENIVTSWLLTIPATAGLGGLLYWLLAPLF